jgi:O-antigen/teichoic acid export membrane protein
MLSGLFGDIIFNKPGLSNVLRIIVIGIPFIVGMQILLSAFQGAKKLKQKIVVQQLILPPSRLMIISLAIFLGGGVSGVVWAWNITAFLGFILTILLFRRHFGWWGTIISNGVRKEVVRYSLPLLFSRVLNQNSNRIGIIIIGILLSAEDVGIYGVAMRSLPFLMVPLVAYNAIFSPIISALYRKGKMRNLEGVYKSGAKWVINVSLPLYALMVYFSDYIVRIFGTSFEKSTEIMVILLSGQLIVVISGSAGFVLSMTGRTLFNLYNSACLCVFNLLLSVMLVKYMGTSGAAYAYIISIALFQLVQLWQVWHLYRILPYRLEHMKPIFACLLAYIVIFVLRNPLSQAGVFLFISIITVLFLSVYFLLMVIMGLSSEDRMILKSFKQRIVFF